MHELFNSPFFQPAVALYVMGGFMVASRVYFEMLERRPKYIFYQYPLAFVFNFALWPLKLVQTLFVWLWKKVNSDVI